MPINEQTVGPAGFGSARTTPSSPYVPVKLISVEKQRVAIARAWMNEPDLILADEPTASLDTKRGHQVIEQLSEQVKMRKKAAVLVTHDERLLPICDRVIQVVDGHTEDT